MLITEITNEEAKWEFSRDKIVEVITKFYEEFYKRKMGGDEHEEKEKRRITVEEEVI